LHARTLGGPGHFIPWNKGGITWNKGLLFHGITLFLLYSHVIPMLFHYLFHGINWNKHVPLYSILFHRYSIYLYSMLFQVYSTFIPTWNTV
jgi:hypothetical protein